LFYFREEIEKRIDVIEGQIKITESNYDKEKLEERLAKFKGGIGLIKVGGGSEVEVGEIKDRVTDALCATKAAIAEGIVPGGGTALLYASKELNKLIEGSSNLTEGEIAGIRIIQSAIRIPLQTICNNAGFQGSLIAAKLLEENNVERGFNAAKGTYVDMRKEGIIDPTKVVRTALIDSSSVASLMLTTECMIYDEVEKKDKN
jgi:chaperonin GroEL